ncbi:hypothetical protein [Emticicia sp. BO119]|uniref:hypothetical protein n=1 Tax=Emticicia sp. BO119 TaxID=2757768 RepID=UPI0015F030C4|nr:hypothetical protein [Emticicia sp. BO119]MBA4853911.1 hypothetical protein [Emticicia sp. BO119]
MKIVKYLIGPELLWLLVFIGIKYFGRYNISTQGKYNDSIENMAYVLPLVVILACMSIYGIAVAPKEYLLIRIIIVSLIGSHFVFSYCAGSHTAGGPGAGMIYIAGICFTLLLLFIAGLVKLFFFSNK